MAGSERLEGPGYGITIFLESKHHGFFSEVRL
jgi:hypothetical protein